MTMYHGYFGLESAPFSIVPDHRLVYMSDSHREAVAHLLYSLKQSGGFVQLTGEVGTGKTTVCRYLLQHLPDNVDVALMLNPRVNEQEMLEVICDELGISYPSNASLKQLVAVLNEHLLASHGEGRHTVLIIDEAQNLSREVLEQVRLLTNLETTTDKLLQIILIGQPELVSVLGRHDLRQLSQRIIGRFKLDPLNLMETREYIRYRLQQSGCERELFRRGAVNRIHKLSGGVPRVINVLCDSALMATYADNKNEVSKSAVQRVAAEVLPKQEKQGLVVSGLWRFALVPALLLLVVLVILVFVKQPVFSGLLADATGVRVRITDPVEPAEVISSVEPESGSITSDTEQPADTAKRQSSENETTNRFDLIYRLGVPYQNN